MLRVGTLLLALSLNLLGVCAHAQSLTLHGRWLTADAPGQLEQPLRALPPNGGHFVYQADFDIARAGAYVLDFKNSSVIGLFSHELRDATGALVFRAEGGLQSTAQDPFFLRHGRALSLQPGHYRLQSRVQSPFFLAQPEPYLDELAHYQQAIKPGNSLVLLCLGIFIGLGMFYGVLGLMRRRPVEGLYAAFILGNLLYNGTALLVAKELLDLRWFYLISAPVLLSNMAYVAFVMALLEVRRSTSPRLFAIGRGLLGLLGLLAILAMALPHWSLEFTRAGVAMFLLYGFAAGVTHARRGVKLAWFYLAANLGFFLTGGLAISLGKMEGVQTLYVEHLGLLAVTIEVLLLALVLAHQFGQLQQERQAALRDKEQALLRAEQGLRLACTDALTELPNRYALDQALAALPPQGSLTLVDLDGLKQINDRYGHVHGDQSLCAFADALRRALGARATAHRLGGDEFAVLSLEGDFPFIEQMVGEAILAAQMSGFKLQGASFGSASLHEAANLEQLKHLADTRMYQRKRLQRALREQEGALSSCT